MSLGQKKRLYEQTKHAPGMKRKERRTGIKIFRRFGDINEVKDVGRMRSLKSKEK